MTRQELVSAAKAAGIAKANTLKSVVLEEMLTAIETAAPVVEKTERRGRPVNESSARQMRFKEIEEKRAAGLIQKGRPVNGDSARQKRLAELEEKAAAGLLHKGRPVDTTSARQKRLAELAAKAEVNGGVIKRGRPAAVKVEPAIEVTEDVVVNDVDGLEIGA